MKTIKRKEDRTFFEQDGFPWISENGRIGRKIPGLNLIL